MKTISEFKRGECFWKHGMLYKVITKFDGSFLRAKCIADGEVERFEDTTEIFSIKAL